MEHNNATNSATNLRQHQQQQLTREPSITHKLHDQPQEQQQQQQTINNNNNDNQQQFCLRWHNHQTSLLSTLPILLDQSHLTDVTISAEGRTLRAHRVVLSACSSFFLEIFRTLESTHHPVIIIPGASFSAIVALLTFMYSGEVNVYEEQIPLLLSLAETLGIKGLADVHNNLQKTAKVCTEKDSLDSAKEEPEEKSPSPSSPQPTHTSAVAGNLSLPSSTVGPNLNTPNFNPLLASSLNSKLPPLLENFFLKSLQLYPNLMQPLNFSQTALNKTSELLAKYQQQCNLYQSNLGGLPSLLHSETEENSIAKRFCAGLDKKSPSLSSQQMQQQQPNQMTLQQQKDIKRIDKIVENLRGGASNTSNSVKQEKSHDNLNNSPNLTPHLHNQLTPLQIKTSMESYSTNTSPLLATKSSLFSSPTSADSNAQLHSQLPYNISPEDQLKLQQHLDKYAQSCARSMEAANENLKNEAARMLSNEKLSQAVTSPQAKAPSNSKLYATCFICHKQLSNQYNLRVHLETHQNVRYACNVCTHVSRSKDALRKHVSYRHPGAPSPCETEARRKRANKVLATQLNAAGMAHNSPSSGEVTPTSPNALTHFSTVVPPTSSSSATSSSLGHEVNCNESSSGLTAAQLSSAYQMFMPNQFHLAAAAANAAQQQQQQQQQHHHNPLNDQQSPQMTSKDFNSNLSPLLNASQSSPSNETLKSSIPTTTNAATTTTTSTPSVNPNDITNSNPNNNNTNNRAEDRISPNLNT